MYFYGIHVNYWSWLCDNLLNNLSESLPVLCPFVLNSFYFGVKVRLNHSFFAFWFEVSKVFVKVGGGISLVMITCHHYLHKHSNCLLLNIFELRVWACIKRQCSVFITGYSCMCVYASVVYECVFCLYSLHIRVVSYGVNELLRSLIFCSMVGGPTKSLV